MIFGRSDDIVVTESQSPPFRVNLSLIEKSLTYVRNSRPFAANEAICSESRECRNPAGTLNWRALRLPCEAIDEVISGDARALSANLQMLREKLFPPEAKKQLRKFSSGEAAKLIGVTDSYLRLLSTTGEGPAPEMTAGGAELTLSNKFMNCESISRRASPPTCQRVFRASIFKRLPSRISKAVRARQRAPHILPNFLHCGGIGFLR